MRRARWIIGIALISALAACSGASPEATQIPAPAAPTETVAEPQVPSAMAPVPSATMGAAAAEPTAVDDSIPVGSSALHASDPTTASLSGEKPRFVEFFAFW